MEKENAVNEYVIHQHHHYGWTTNVHEADNPEEALRADVLKYHPWLAEHEHELVLKEGRYSVSYEGAAPREVFGGFQYKGDHWFGDQIRVGEADDCNSCGGTGVNHYYSWCQCWKCGEPDDSSRAGYRTGRSSGKRMIAEAA